MNCSRYGENISEEVDGELIDTDSLTLMRHLVECRNCRDEYQALLRLRDIIKVESPASSMEVSPQFSMKVMAAINESESSTNKAFEPAPVKNIAKIMDIVLPLKRFFTLQPAFMPISVALSFILVVSVTLFYRNSHNDEMSNASLADAKVIRASLVKTDMKPTGERDEDGLNYYVKRHEKATSGNKVYSALAQRGTGFSYVSYGSVSGAR